MPSNQTRATIIEETFDNLLEGCQLISRDWRYLYVNNALLRQSKYASRDELIGYTMMEKYPGIEKTEMFSVLKECMESSTTSTMENEFIFPDNSTGWFELRIEPMPRGLFILSIDITERKMAETDRVQYVKGLENMVFMTSHRLRQPVSNILGLMHILEVSRITKDDLVKMCTYMKDSIVSIDRFTIELTDYLQNLKTRTSARRKNNVGR